MVKFLSCVVLLNVLISQNLCRAIAFKKPGSFVKYCSSKVKEYSEWAHSRGEWSEEIRDTDGKKLVWLISPDKKYEILDACTDDERMMQLEERSRYTHNGLNFELDRIESGLEPCYNTHHTYQIFGSKDRYPEVGQRLLESVADAEKRLKDRKEEIDLEYKLYLEKNGFSISDFFVPKNKKAAVTVALGTGAGAFLVYSGLEATEEKKDEKKLNIRVPLLMSIFYIGSTFFANLFTKPYTEPPKPYLSDAKYRAYYDDLKKKKAAVCKFYAALTGESKHCAYAGMDDEITEEKTLSGLPLREAIEKFGFVLDLPYSPEKIWSKSYDSLMEEVLKNPGAPDVRAQNEVYTELIREFGEDFVKDPEHNEPKIKAKYIPKK